jgi:hypothetical protein
MKSDRPEPKKTEFKTPLPVMESKPKPAAKPKVAPPPGYKPDRDVPEKKNGTGKKFIFSILHQPNVINNFQPMLLLEQKQQGSMIPQKTIAQFLLVTSAMMQLKMKLEMFWGQMQLKLN